MSGLQLALRSAPVNGFQLSVEHTLPPTGVTAVYGPSGSGKTTLLKLIAGLEHAQGDSHIQFNGDTWQSTAQFTPPWQRHIGFVFQDARLFPHLSAGQNLDYASRLRGRRPGFERAQVAHWLGLESLLDNPATALSAGQQQRVAIARALMSGPRLLLLDEPFANLDSSGRRQCLAHLQRLRRELKLPMVYVSHDIEEVCELADQLLLLNDGAVEAYGSPLELCSRLDTSLSHSEHAAALITGSVAQHDGEFGLTSLAVEGQSIFLNQLDAPKGSSHRLRVPARDVSVGRQAPLPSSILNVLRVELKEIESSSEARVLLRLALGEQYLLARITRKSAAALKLAVGDTLYAQIKSVALLSEARPQFSNQDPL